MNQIWIGISPSVILPEILFQVVCLLCLYFQLQDNKRYEWERMQKHVAYYKTLDQHLPAMTDKTHKPQDGLSPD